MDNKFDKKNKERGGLMGYMLSGGLTWTIAKGASKGGFKNPNEILIAFLEGLASGAATRGIMEIVDSIDDSNTEVKRISPITEIKKLELCIDGYGIKPETEFVNILELGKTYVFKVDEYSICPPKDLNRIKWEYTVYSTDGTDKTVTLCTKVDWVNRTFSLTINDNNLIGKNIVISAYINQIQPEASFKAVMKNEFYSFEWGELQDHNPANATASVARKWDLSTIIDQLKLDDFGIERAEIMNSKSEEEVRRIYEGGIIGVFKLQLEIARCWVAGLPLTYWASMQLQRLLRGQSVTINPRKLWVDLIDSKTQFIGTALVLSGDDDLRNIVIDHFYNGNGEPLCWGVKSNMSQCLRGHDAFQEFFRKYLKVVSRHINNLDNVSGERIGKEITFEYYKEAHQEYDDKAFDTLYNKLNGAAPNLSTLRHPNYYGLMGGTQRIKADLDVTPLPDGRHKVHTIMHIYDWYGADAEDLNGWLFGKGLNIKAQMECLNAFYWLQYHYGYKPFQTEIIYEHTDIL